MRTRLLLFVLSIFVLTTADNRAQQSPDAAFTLKQIGPSVWAAINNPNSKIQGGSNAGFVIGDDGVIVIDTLGTIEAARQLLSQVRKVTSLPIKFAVNTHFHIDHVAGNQLFADAGATVVAHRNVIGWIHSENLKLAGPEKPDPQFKAFVDAVVPPKVGYEGTLSLHLGSRLVQVLSFPGHTGGDSVVLIPDARVAFAGDLFWLNIFPNMINASTRPWIATLDTMVKNGAEFTFVPGHGETGTAQDVTVFRDYLATLMKAVTDARTQKKTGTALTEAVMSVLEPKYGGWEYFKFLAARNIEQMDAELSGTKQVPQPLP
jgi:cyclase